MKMNLIKSISRLGRFFLNSISGLLGISLLVFSASSAKATSYTAEQNTLEKRVIAVRQVLKENTQQMDESEANPIKTAQWPNWPNWNNWGNWPNWGNWANWLNY